MNDKPLPPLRLSWTIWGLAAALYLFAFFQRVAPGVMTSELSVEFGLTAAALGNLSALYFYSYVAMQIPTGILADIWGPRRLLTAGALVAGVGSLMFSFSSDIGLAGIGRLLIGGSVAVTFVSMLKLAHHWFLPRQFAMASGMALFVGIVGAVFAGVPLQMSIDSYGWRQVMAVSAAWPIIIGLIVWIVVRDDPREKGYQGHVTQQSRTDAQPWKHALKGLQEVFRFKNTWVLSIVPGGVVGSITAFAGLWGVPFLVTHHGMSKTEAAAICSAMLIAWAIAGPLFGFFSDHFGRRKSFYIFGCAVIAMGWSIIYLVPDLEKIWLITLLMTIGMASGCMILGFAFAKESVPQNLAGTVSGVVNMGVMTGPMILQPAVGWMLDRGWQGEMINQVKVYNLDAYSAGFSLMAGWAILSFVLIIFSRESEMN
jgi:sugar phosphate permease